MAAALQHYPLITILRNVKPDEVVDICQAIVDQGVGLLEITMNSPTPGASIRLAAEHFAGTPVAIGAGTVLTPQQVEEVAEAGGAFIISPDCNPEVIRRTKQLGLLSLPGVFTPTEALLAIRHGADFLKLFPAGHLPPAYIKDLKAVVAADFIAVGGVGPANLRDYLGVAVGAGIGSAIYQAGRSAAAVARAAAELVRALPPA